MIIEAWVTLSVADLSEADRVAVARNGVSRARGYGNKHGLNGDKVDILKADILGARGELAACCVLNILFEGRIDNFKEADIGEHIQVRTGGSHSHRLIYRDGDNDEHIYILVTTDSEMKTFCVRGSIDGAAARKVGRLETYGGRPPAWFVIQADLQPIGFLMGRT